MFQLILTGLVGVVCGVVLMRFLQTPVQPDAGAELPAPSATGKAGGKLVEVQAAPAVQTPWAKLQALPRSKQMLVAAGGLVAIAGAGFLIKGDGTDNAVTAPATAATGGAAGNLDSVDVMIERLETRLKANPADGEGYRMLGWSYASTGKPDKAVEAYKRAFALLPNRADVAAGLGEAMVSVSGDRVSSEAKAIFEKAIALDAKEPRASFFLSLFKAQNGDEKAALEEWITLANSSAASQQWQPDLRKRITDLAAKLKVDVSGRLKNESAASGTGSSAPAISPDAVSSMNALPPAERQGAIDGMVEGLAEKLRKDPGNAEGWARLIRSRVVLKQNDRAKADLATARKALAGDANGLAEVNATAAELGL